ncbi:hypothetical protein K503DRAFT_427314 [Rhizopogon vinicolor AM-OR11-026]|uniref:Uncharacterized protein n=1 Tax=Rhizopogon vinicolor AM-OR11-026 TaxID=1314800 RepID=A0A1B7NB07_9AGAM|nr:hypothetical protein K503DRAFT_427314 [Rhizopogon vinicolor AM-OR11-026]
MFTFIPPTVFLFRYARGSLIENPDTISNSYRNTCFFPTITSVTSLHSERLTIWDQPMCSMMLCDSGTPVVTSLSISPQERSSPQSYWVAVRREIISEQRSVHCTRTKFQFQLCQPFVNLFAEDFDKAIQSLEGLQAKISETADRRNMGVSDKNVKLIRFTSNMFDRINSPSPNMPFIFTISRAPRAPENIDNSPVMDVETDNWPVPMKTEMNRLGEIELRSFPSQTLPQRLLGGAGRR